MEPILNTAPELSEILKELSSREPIFHRSEWGTSRSDFEGMMADEFWEVGASGQRYSKEHVLNVLEKRQATPQTDIWRTSDFHCRKLADNIYLLTYTLLQNHERLTRRTTIWEQTTGDWKIVYHQGTIVQDAHRPV